MSTCHSCGGVIGRDCFNPQECEAITRDMAQRYQEMNERDSQPRSLASKERNLIRAVDDRPNPHVAWLREVASHLHAERRTAFANTCEGAAKELESIIEHRNALLVAHESARETSAECTCPVVTSNHDVACPRYSPPETTTPQCRHTATNGTTLVRANDKITCSVCGALVHDFSVKASCESSGKIMKEPQ